MRILKDKELQLDAILLLGATALLAAIFASGCSKGDSITGIEPEKKQETVSVSIPSEATPQDGGDFVNWSLKVGTDGTTFVTNEKGGVGDAFGCTVWYRLDDPPVPPGKEAGRQCGVVPDGATVAFWPPTYLCYYCFQIDWEINGSPRAWKVKDFRGVPCPEPTPEPSPTPTPTPTPSPTPTPTPSPTPTPTPSPTPSPSPTPTPPPPPLCGSPSYSGPATFELDSSGDAAELAWVTANVLGGPFYGPTKYDLEGTTSWTNTTGSTIPVVLVKAANVYAIYLNVLPGGIVYSQAYNKKGIRQDISHVSLFECAE